MECHALENVDRGQKVLSEVDEAVIKLERANLKKKWVALSEFSINYVWSVHSTLYIISYAIVYSNGLSFCFPRAPMTAAATS